VRRVIGSGINWKDECAQEEGVMVEELGKWMMLKESSMGEEALLKMIKVTGGESTNLW
jgi:hypothetical protein